LSERSRGFLKRKEDEMKVRKERKAFTLLELLIVMVIIGILAIVAIPQYLDAIETANETTSIQQLQEVREMWNFIIAFPGAPLPDPAVGMCLDSNNGGLGDGECEKSLPPIAGAACGGNACTLNGISIALDTGVITLP
jgi:prepilin-type N-terminal cleavage/methylation domain-containing protein